MFGGESPATESEGTCLSSKGEELLQLHLPTMTWSSPVIEGGGAQPDLSYHTSTLVMLPKDAAEWYEKKIFFIFFFFLDRSCIFFRLIFFFSLPSFFILFFFLSSFFCLAHFFQVGSVWQESNVSTFICSWWENKRLCIRDHFIY